MTAVVIAGIGALLALLALVTYVVTLIRGAERERADALVLAEKVRGESNLTIAKATAEIEVLADDVRRQTRRADALEDHIRGDLIRRHGAVDAGTDLLLAELSIVAAGARDSPGTIPLAPGSDPGQGTVFVDPSGSGPTARRGVDAASDGLVSDGDEASGRVPTDPLGRR